MRIPTRPPNFLDNFVKKLKENPSFMNIGGRPEVAEFLTKANNEPWNWDDCKYRAPLAQLSVEDFWILVKSYRLNKKKLPLVDTRGEPFSYTQPSIVQHVLHRIDLQLGGNITATGPTITTDEERTRYLISSLQEEAISSSLIEGAVATREQAREMIRTERAPRDKHERMILNNYRTIRFLNERRQENLTPELLCEVQRMLTDGTLGRSDAAGRFRTEDEKIDIADFESGEVLHTPPPASQLADRVRALCAFANAPSVASDVNEFVHPAIRAIALHFWLAFDHPFVDGNGRTARALFYWSMLRQGYWLTEYLSISSIIAGQAKQYGLAYLNAEIDDNDFTYFLIYHLRVIERSIDEFHKYVERKKAEQAKVVALLHGQFNARQQALLTRALKDPTARFTFESHAHSHGVTPMTARADLLDLEKRGFLTGNRVGRRFEFSPAAGIDGVIEKSKRKKRKR